MSAALSNQLVKRAIEDADIGWFLLSTSTDVCVRDAGEMKYLVASYREKSSGRHLLAGRGPLVAFPKPITGQLPSGIGLSAEALNAWLLLPLDKLATSLRVIGAGVIAPVIRQQIQRRVVALWRSILGQEGYQRVLTFNKDIAVKDIQTHPASPVIAQLLGIKEGSVADAALFSELLMYVGAQELWGFLKTNAPDRMDRARLLIPPSLFTSDYQPQLEFSQMISMINSASEIKERWEEEEALS